MEVASLAESLFFVTVRIDTQNADGSSGCGTGFLFNFKHEGKEYPFIITNKHVVSNSISGGLTFIQGNNEKPNIGESYRVVIDDFKPLWHGHPDIDIDIAVTPFVPIHEFIRAQGVDVFYRTVGFESIPTTDQIKTIDALEEVVFVGYPNGLWDQKNYTPILRKGITATPIALDYEGEKKFLIDASVFGGSSGSPVFIYQTGTYSTKNGPAMVGTKFFFVGVVAAVYFRTQQNDIVSLPIPTSTKDVVINNEMLDLGIVFKAETVVEVVKSLIELNSNAQK